MDGDSVDKNHLPPAYPPSPAPSYSSAVESPSDDKPKPASNTQEQEKPFEDNKEIKPQDIPEKASTPKESHTSEINFIFGPSNSYYCNYEKAWQYVAIVAQEWSQWSMSTPFCVALADPGWYVAYEAQNGTVQRRFNKPETSKPSGALRRGEKKKWNARHIAYGELDDWIQKNVITKHDFQQTTIVFGPGTTYFAESPTSSQWNNLPDDLLKKMQEKGGQGAPKTPARVTFGVEQAWAAFWDDGTFHLNFCGKYNTLEELLQSNNKDQVSYLSLNPYTPDEYFVRLRTNTIQLRMNMSVRTSPQPELEIWMQRICRQNDTTMTLTISSSSGNTTTVISPTSNVQRTDTTKDDERQEQPQQEESDQTKKKSSTKVVGAAAAGVVLGAIACEVM